jgi:hypothetical protein
MNQALAASERQHTMHNKNKNEWQPDPELLELELLEESERQRIPNQTPNPSFIPQGYVDPLYQSALAEMQRWVVQYKQYRMQGNFAQLEPIFQTIKQITGR